MVYSQKITFQPEVRRSGWLLCSYILLWSQQGQGSGPWLVQCGSWQTPHGVSVGQIYMYFEPAFDPGWNRAVPNLLPPIQVEMLMWVAAGWGPWLLAGPVGRSQQACQHIADGLGGQPFVGSMQSDKGTQTLSFRMSSEDTKTQITFSDSSLWQSRLDQNTNHCSYYLTLGRRCKILQREQRHMAEFQCNIKVL